MSEKLPTITVHGLTCHRDVDMTVVTFGSLLKFSVDPLNLLIHDDGSLTPQDQEKLLSAIPNSKLVRRSEADEFMAEALKHYPNCLQYRRDCAYGLKLLDIACMSQGDIAFCDSDILFLRPFKNLFQFPNPQTSALMMLDYIEGYSILPWQLLRIKEFKLPSKANSGLIFFRKEAYDFDFVEWFLGQDEFRFKQKLNVTEQTCWAAQAYRVGMQFWDPNQIVLMRPTSQLTDEMIAGHFVKEIRYRLSEFQGLSQQFSISDPPCEPKTVPPQACSLLDLSTLLMGRQLKRLRNYHKIPSLVGQKVTSMIGKSLK